MKSRVGDDSASSLELRLCSVETSRHDCSSQRLVIERGFLSRLTSIGGRENQLNGPGRAVRRVSIQSSNYGLENPVITRFEFHLLRSHQDFQYVRSWRRGASGQRGTLGLFRHGCRGVRSNRGASEVRERGPRASPQARRRAAISPSSRPRRAPKGPLKRRPPKTGVLQGPKNGSPVPLGWTISRCID